VLIIKKLYNKNSFVEVDDYLVVYILNRNNIETGESFLISKEDIDLIYKHRYYISGRSRKETQRYAQTRIDNKNVGIHRQILNAKPKEYVDHINHNPMDNRRENLRMCTNQQNAFNCTNNTNNTSGVKGVWFDKSRNKWACEIMINYKKAFFKRYDTFEEAKNKRFELELEYFNEFSPNH